MLIRDWDDLKEWVRDHRARNRDLLHFEKVGASADAIVRDGEYARLQELVSKAEVQIGPGVRGLWERSRRARRRREIRIAATAVGIGAWAVLSTASWLRATGERDDAQLKEVTAREQALISGAHGFVARGEPVWAAKLLLEVKAPETAPGFVEAANAVLGRRLPLRTFPGTLPALSPDGERLFTAEPWSGEVLVHGTGGEGQTWSLPGALPGVDALSVSPDGTRVVAASSGLGGSPGGVRVWQVVPGAPATAAIDLPASGPVWSAGGQSFGAIVAGQPHVFSADGRAVRAVARGPRPAHTLALSPDGRTLLVGRSGEDGSRSGAAEVWSLSPGAPCPGGAPCLVATLHERAWALGFSPDGWSVFVAHEGSETFEQAVSTWGADRWSVPVRTTPLGASDPLLPEYGSVKWLDGESWVVASIHSAAVVKDGRRVQRLTGTTPVEVSRDGTRLLSATGTSAFVEERAPAAPRIDLAGQSGLVSAAAFDPQGRFVVTSSDVDGTSRLFRLEGESGLVFRLDDESSSELPGRVVLGAGRRRAVVQIGGEDDPGGGTYLLRLVPPRAAERLPPGRVELSPDEEHLLFMAGGGVSVASAANWQSARPALREPCEAIDAVFDRAGGHVIVLCADGALRRSPVGSPGDSEVLATFEGCEPEEQVSLSLAGESALVRCGPGDLRAWLSGAPPFDLVDWCGPESGWTLSPDGSTVACWDPRDAVAIVDLHSPEAPRYFSTGSGGPVGAWFGRARADLTVTTSGNTAHVLGSDPRDDVELPRHPQPVLSVHLDRAGEVAVTVSTDGWVRVFRFSELDAPPEVLRTSRLSFDAPALALSEDGTAALVASGDRTVRLFHLSKAGLRAELARANADCLPAELRRGFLGEAAVDAKKAFAECEESAGR